VELDGTKDINQGDDKEKGKGLKNNDLELKKNHQKEELKKELDLVSTLKAKGSCSLSSENLPL
jgi:hypothetical protein